ncbi:MAG: hypothetical protein CL938_00225 [Deltaproteobacteria bacterium]|nr:hypothetical protein [Deltaproteobacteria bacterium]
MPYAHRASMRDDPSVRDVYFAYDSNLHSARIVSRVPSARTLGAHLLESIRFTLDKPCRDGSAKANLCPHPACWTECLLIGPGENTA